MKPPAPPFQTDSTNDTLFNWQYMNIPGYYFVDLCAYDTNNVYLLFPFGLVTVHGNIYSETLFNDTDFYANKINAFDMSNIFIGGQAHGVFTVNSKLKKWNGTGFTDIIIPQDSSNGIHDILVKGAADVWFATKSNKIYHYDGTLLSTYFLSNRIVYPTLFLDSIGNLFCLVQIQTVHSPGPFLFTNLTDPFGRF